MIKALVFGKDGQLGRSLAMRSPDFAGVNLLLLDRNACDVLNSASITSAVELHRPDVIINATAYTAVDLAESQVEIAQRINCDAVRGMAENARRQSVPLIHISTDYVFDGERKTPYRETDRVSPLGIYGKTKLAGEEGIQEITEKHLIFRTSWLYSPFGKNFVQTMLTLLSQKTEIGVVNDQRGCPTSCLDLAGAILNILPEVTHPRFEKFGTYHLVPEKQMTWYDFTRAIQFEATKILGKKWPGTDCQIKAVTSAQFPTLAKRPSYSVLSAAKFTASFGFHLPDFNHSLTEVLQISAEGEEDA